MFNFDYYANENKRKHNLKCPYIPDHPYRILIIIGSGSGKTNALLNLINNQPDIDKISDAKHDQAELKSGLNEIEKGNKKHRSKEQKISLHNIEMLYKARNSVIELSDDYSSMVSEAKPYQILAFITNG